ncbi:MAG: SufD family Fe-S cluster assembly protein [Malacoplasma sp.]|nr:SufD family Fe-S cluster assembly protein [Malacoplasma sp.]
MSKNNEVYFLNNKNYSNKIYLNNNENKELLIIDIIKDDVDMNLDIYLQNSSNLHLVISSLNNNYKKVFNINVFHNGNESESKCEVFGVNKNNSSTSFFLQAYIKDDSKANYCEQKIRGVLLSDNAEIKGKPNLIIDTNNIKAKHALAIGRLNLAHVFYLQSKGIKKSDAIKLLLLSYFNVILYKIDDEKAKERLMERIFLEIGEIQ